MTSGTPAADWVDDYLARIGLPRPVSADLEALRDLQTAHLLAVPFENLSVHLREPIVLDQAALVTKVARMRRGGFCYELNGAFAGLLTALGFRVSLLSARRQAGAHRRHPVAGDGHVAHRVQTRFRVDDPPAPKHHIIGSHGGPLPSPQPRGGRAFAGIRRGPGPWRIPQPVTGIFCPSGRLFCRPGRNIISRARPSGHR